MNQSHSEFPMKYETANIMLRGQRPLKGLLPAIWPAATSKRGMTGQLSFYPEG